MSFDLKSEDLVSRLDSFLSNNHGQFSFSYKSFSFLIRDLQELN